MKHASAEAVTTWSRRNVQGVARLMGHGPRQRLGHPRPWQPFNSGLGYSSL